MVMAFPAVIAVAMLVTRQYVPDAEIVYGTELIGVHAVAAGPVGP